MVLFINSVKQGSVSENETITFKGPSKTNRIGVVKKSITMIFMQYMQKAKMLLFLT